VLLYAGVINQKNPEFKEEISDIKLLIQTGSHISILLDDERTFKRRYNSYFNNKYNASTEAKKDEIKVKRDPFIRQKKYSVNKVLHLEKEKPYRGEVKAIIPKLNRLNKQHSFTIKQKHRKTYTKKKLYRSIHKKIIRPPPKRVRLSLNVDLKSKTVKKVKNEEKVKIPEKITESEDILQTNDTQTISEIQEDNNYENLKEIHKPSSIELLNEHLQNRSVLAEIKPGYSYVKKDNFEINKKSSTMTAETRVLVDSDNNIEQTLPKSNKADYLVSTVYLKEIQQPDNSRQTALSTGNNKNLDISDSRENKIAININKQTSKNTASIQKNKITAQKTIQIDYKKVKTSIIRLRINDRLGYDIEAVIFPDNQVSVPIKYLANLVEVETTQNHLTSSITFEQPFTQEKITVDHQNKQITVGSNIISNIDPKLVYFKEGFIVSDDIYVPRNIADELLNVKTSFSPSKYLLELKTTNILRAIVKMDENPNETSSFVYAESFQSITENESENKLFNIKQLNYNLGSSSNRSISDNITSNSSNANAGIMATGSLLGGDYQIGTNSLYSESSMEINGYRASLDYKRGKYDLSLGKTNAILSQLAASGASIWGFRFGTAGANGGSIDIPRYITGRADENSSVELYINDIFSERQHVKNGEYVFDTIKYPHDYSVKIRVEQVSQDNSRKVIYEHKFSLDRRLLVQGQKQLLLFSGIDNNGLNERCKLFGDNLDGGLYEPLRFITGSKFRLGILEKLTMGVNYADSIIIKNPANMEPNTTNSLYVAKAFRTGRTSSGSVMSMDMDYVPFKNLRLNTEGGFSKAKSKIDPSYDPDGKDFGGLVSADYNKKGLNLNLKGFSYGPDYYSGTTTNLIDQRGVDLNSSISLGKASFSGNIRRYNSNLDNYFKGGIAKVLEYRSSISGNVDDYSTVSFGISSFDTENSIYKECNSAFDITYKRKFSPNVDLTLNSIHNTLKQDNNDLNTTYKSTNQLFNMELDYNTKKLGIFRFIHQSYLMNTTKKLFTDPDSVSRDFTLRLDRSSKFNKGISISPVVGYRYSGDNKGIITGLSASHKFQSGAQLVLSYIYNSNSSDTIGGNILIGGNRSHSLTFNLVQSVNFGVKKLVNAKSGETTSINPDNGIVKGTVFADLNQNGIKEADETGIPGIDIKTSNGTKTTTDKDGNYFIANLSETTHKFGIDKENLPAIYTPTVANAVVNVKLKRVYVANLGIIASPGSVSGRVTIDKGGLNNSQVIVQILDKNGKEVKYTTTDSKGYYNIDSIPAGEYSVIVCKDYLEYLGLEDKKEIKHLIVIPNVIDDFVDIKDVDIILTPIQNEARKFSI